MTGTSVMQSDVQCELPAGRVIAAALAAGALTPADVVHHGVLVEQVGRSHAVYRVSVGGVARFYLKTFGPRRGDTDGSPAREAAVLALAAERPAVAALVPAPWPWAAAATVRGAGSAGRGAGSAGRNDATGDLPPWTVIATAAVEGAEAWTLDRAGGGRQSMAEAWTALVGSLAPRLAAFHRATRDLARPGATVPPALRASEPWALRLMDGDAAPELWATPVTAAILREAAADPVLVSGLREARAAWRPLALVHADLKHDNILVTGDGDGLRTVVLDWEMARVGDPAWDLAGLTARLAAARPGAPPWPDDDVALTALLVRTYAEASGLRVPGLAQRQVLYAGAVLLMMALQLGSTLPPGADQTPVRDLSMKARATFHSVAQVTKAIVGVAEAAAS